MKKWPWIIYGSFLIFPVYGALGNLLDKESPIRTYYTILLAFDKGYVVFYTLDIFNILITLLVPLVVFLYALDIESSKVSWKRFFFLRIIMDIVGHQYDVQFLKSAYHQSLRYFLTALVVYILPMIPSYVAHYLYAFKKKN